MPVIEKSIFIVYPQFCKAIAIGKTDVAIIDRFARNLFGDIDYLFVGRNRLVDVCKLLFVSLGLLVYILITKIGKRTSVKTAFLVPQYDNNDAQGNYR